VHVHTGVMSHLIGPRDWRRIAQRRVVRPSPYREQGRARAWIGLDASVDAGRVEREVSSVPCKKNSPKRKNEGCCPISLVSRCVLAVDL